ncbi:MAG: hypothetical protein DCC58_17945 [Chloroflexi bacterium]|nr:MAG: hypothetical protein DCC58_17945 [Chloroflexota bacterium]
MFDILASNYPITLVAALGLLYVWSRNQSAFAGMWNDRSAWGRRVSRATFVALGMLLIWISIFDNWRQLLGFLVDEKNRWRSDLYLYEPPSDAVRFVTWSLFVITLLGTASLFARYGSGYVLPLLISLGSIVLFFILNNLRMTFEPAGPLSERGVDYTDPLEALMTFVWFGIFYCVMATLLYSAFAIFWGPAAFVMALAYRTTIGRRKIEEPDMFRIIRERSSLRSTGDGRSPHG